MPEDDGIFVFSGRPGQALGWESHHGTVTIFENFRTRTLVFGLDGCWRNNTNYSSRRAFKIESFNPQTTGMIATLITCYVNDSDGLNQIEVAIGQKSLSNESLFHLFVSDRDF